MMWSVENWKSGCWMVLKEKTIGDDLTRGEVAMFSILKREIVTKCVLNIVSKDYLWWNVFFFFFEEISDEMFV